jgi:hypothetical protein
LSFAICTLATESDYDKNTDDQAEREKWNPLVKRRIKGHKHEQQYPDLSDCLPDEIE